jgi:diguanylate cyclase (GGDEF)-like protein
MLNPQRLERLVLEAVAKVSRDRWVPLSVAELINRVPESDKQAANASSTEIVETVIALEEGNLISIQKWQGSPPILVPYDPASSKRESYISAFFWRGSFELRLTHDGRKRLGQIEVIVADSMREPDQFDDLLRPLYRRKIFDADLPRFAAEAINLRRPVSLIMIDLDHFSKVNNQYGHPTGDEVLLEISKLLRARVDGKGKAYRYGGEELAVLSRNYTVEEATALAEIVRKDVESASLSERKIRMTVSLGVACLPGHATDGPGLLQKADDALNQAKRLGRNLVRVSGEPETLPETPRSVSRRQPSPFGLSEEEQEAIREMYFQGRQPSCPRDGAILRVSEAQQVPFRTPHLRVACPLCGLIQDIRAPI